MAVTITNIFQGVDASVNDIIATADADAAATIPHGLGSLPFIPTEAYAMGRLVGAAVPKFVGLTSIDGTNVNLTLGTAVGSGNAGAQLRVYRKRPHTVGR
jgi:hypothetical protein